MDTTRFDSLTRHLCRSDTRRTVLGRLAGAGAGLVLTGALGRARPAAAQTCHHGANTCASGYVWREAFPGDVVCVTPSQRTQAAADNAYASSRVDPNGVYGPYTCLPGYVWRDAYDGDAVCVEPWVRDQVHYDNSVAAARIQPGCGYQTSA